MNYQNRIVSYDTEDPKALIPHTRNWRLHPEAQRLAVAGALEEIGWIDEVTVNLRMGNDWPEEQRNVKTVIDGHLRRDIALAASEATVPVKYVDEGDLFPGEEDEDASDGSLLELLDVVVAEPRHEVAKGETWALGEHVLICTDVMLDHATWAVHLLDDNDIFCPYPGPLVALSKKAKEHRLVLVQPDTYLAGHILDRYADVNGENSVEQNH